MRLFPKYVVTALPALALVVLCAGCPAAPPPDDGTDGTPQPSNPCQPNPCTAPNKTVCSVSNGAAVCECLPGYTPQGEGCQKEPTPTCAGQHTLGDAFEPDECPTLAHAASISGIPESHTLTTATDEDWSRLATTTGTIYEVAAFGDSGLLLRVDLYGADGSTVLASVTGGADGTSLAYKARTTGNLFARVLSADRVTAGAYGVAFSELGTDDLPDEPAQATGAKTPAETPASGALQFIGDTDVVRVKLEGGGRVYRFDAAWTPALSAVLRLELLGTDGTTVLGSSESTTPRFHYRVTTAGDFFLRVSERTGKQRASYSYTVTDLGLDDHANSPSQATAVSPSTTYTSSKLDYAEDVDVFSFQAEAGHVYQFTCDASAPSPSPAHFSCDVSFVNELGAVWRPGTTPAGVASVSAEFDTASTVYVRVTAKNSFTDGSYQWRLTDLEKDDHGDTVATATPVTVSGTATPGRFELPEDQDVLAFEAQAGHIYELTCTVSDYSCTATFLNAASSTLRSASGASAVVQYKFSTAGTYYARLLPVSPPATPATYQWTLKDIGTDDHGDTLETATAITPSASPAPAKLEFAGDEDWFSFQAQATQAFSFTCDSGGAFNCNVYITNAAGTVLASDASSSLNATVIHRFATAGTYYVHVMAGDSKAAGYSWQLVDRGVDDHTDTPVGASTLALNTDTPGKLQVQSDVDYFVVTLAASTTYTATLTAGANVSFTVYGPDKVTVLASGQGSKDFNSGGAGTYYVRVSYLAPQTAVTSYSVLVKVK